MFNILPEPSTQRPFDDSGRPRKLLFLFFCSVALLYLAFSPATIEGMGYYGENLAAADQLLTGLFNFIQRRPLTPLTWTRHGGLELLFELPFTLVSRLCFGASIKWAGRVLALQPILATALLMTLVLAWTRRLTGDWRNSYAVALAGAFATMLWPYAYIGLETTQSVCLLAAGYLALGRPARKTWLEVFIFAGCCASVLALKLTGLFLLPAVGYLGYCYFSVEGFNRRVTKIVTSLVLIAGIFSWNYYLKEIYWTHNPIGSAELLAGLLVDGPMVWLAQALSFFGSSNKSLLIFAPVTVIGLIGLPRAYRAQPRLVLFALLVLGGLVSGFSLMKVWTEETWGPRYLHAAIAPLLVCLAASQSISGRPHKPRFVLAAATLLGLLVTVPGVLIAYTSLHQAATRSNRATLTAIQYDPAFNHVRFNYRLLRLWLAAQFGGARQPSLWPPPQSWWFDKPTDAASDKVVDLREWATPQPALMREWAPAMSVSPRQHLLLRLLLGGCLGLSFWLFVWQYRLLAPARAASYKLAEEKI